MVAERFSLPRGLRDIPPEEAGSAEAVRSAFVETCRLFGYRLMEPSSLELLETLEAKSGESIRNEIYFFKDKSGRDVGLRFDLTVGITRYVASRRDFSPPVRLGAYSSMWRYDEPQYGRYRWFYQWDVELFGPSNAEADAEVIEFSSTLFTKLGTRPRISIGSRKVVEQFIRNNCKIEEERRVLDAFRAIDKLSKKSIDQVANEYASSISKEDLERIARFAETKGDANEVSKVLAEYRIDSGSLLDIMDSLNARSIEDAELNLKIVRGIDYYTDMVFEAYDKDNPRLGSLCGGGRYDSLPAIYGRPDLGATGVAGGVERAILAYESSSKAFVRNIGVEVFVAPIGNKPEVRRVASSIGADLRREGISVQSEIGDKSLRKILEAHASAGTKALILVGEREIAQNAAKIKWMDTGEEILIKIADLKKELSKRIQT